VISEIKRGLADWKSLFVGDNRITTGVIKRDVIMGSQCSFGDKQEWRYKESHIIEGALYMTTF